LLTDTVSIDYSIDLRLVSDLVGAPVDEIQALNPSLLRMVTPPEGAFDLHLPAGTATLFEQRVALIPEAKRNSWRYHLVATGDTLASVAEEYHVPLTELAEANQLDKDSSIAGMQALLVPVPLALEPLARTRLYTVRRDDTLITIADRFGVSLSELRRWNGIPSGIHVATGRRLHVAEPVVAHSSPHRRRARGAEEASSARPGTSTDGHGRLSETPRRSSAMAHQGSSRTRSIGSASKSIHAPTVKSSSTAQKRATQKPASSSN
jgi:membrane-bound lytic murein transglycosylase D